jgi:spore maturation protein CgeB
LIYSYIPHAEKPLDYVFLASSNSDKRQRYWQYLRPIFKNYRGVINGPGWGQDDLILGREYHRFLYAMAAIGLNLHIPVSLEKFSEINERAYILACCGLFQLTDRPQSLGRVFPSDAIVCADSPAEYKDKFEHYLRHPDERLPFIQRSLDCIYTKHTIFHRMDMLIQKLMATDELKPILEIIVKD